MLSRAELAERADRELESVIRDPGTSPFVIRSTSGTTAAPIVLIQRIAEKDAKRFEGYSTLLLCFGPRPIRLFQVYTASRHRDKKIQRVLCLDEKDMRPDLDALLADFAPEYVQGVTSFVARLFELAEVIHPKKIILAGERVTATLENLLKAKAPEAKLSMRYTTSETGGMGHSCDFVPPNHYHPLLGVSFEIQDPDETGAGDVLITKKHGVRNFDRYAAGDRGRLKHSTCECGATVTLELLGRIGYDYIKIAGALVRQEEFDRVLSKYKNLMDDYRIEVSEHSVDGSLKGAVVVRAYRAAGTITPALMEETARSIERSVYVTPSRTLADLIMVGHFEPLTLIYSDEPLRRGHKNIRLIKVES